MTRTPVRPSARRSEGSTWGPTSPLAGGTPHQRIWDPYSRMWSPEEAVSSSDVCLPPRHHRLRHPLSSRTNQVPLLTCPTGGPPTKPAWHRPDAIRPTERSEGGPTDGTLLPLPAHGESSGPGRERRGNLVHRHAHHQPPICPRKNIRNHGAFALTPPVGRVTLTPPEGHVTGEPTAGEAKGDRGSAVLGGESGAGLEERRVFLAEREGFER